MSDRNVGNITSRPEGGELLASISRRIVQLLARHAGKGPTKCKTHWAGSNMLVVVLGGGYSEAERTLYERGRAEEVRAYRSAIQDALSQDMAAEVEGLTGRKVVAFMSCSHQEPDLLVELFDLSPSRTAMASPTSAGPIGRRLPERVVDGHAELIRRGREAAEHREARRGAERLWPRPTRWRGTTRPRPRDMPPRHCPTSMP